MDLYGAAFLSFVIALRLLPGFVTLSLSLGTRLPAKSHLLILLNDNSLAVRKEGAVMKIVKEFCQHNKVRARNVSKSGMNLAIEVSVGDPSALLSRLMAQEGVTSASLVEHDGDVTV